VGGWGRKRGNAGAEWKSGEGRGGEGDMIEGGGRRRERKLGGGERVEGGGGGEERE